ncbi:MAG: acetolactate synthase [Myxococcales bacterium]|nr:acetolactate synthase [Myxococcales bacterium]
MTIHGGRLVAKALRNEGVEHLFTLCGGHIQSIYDGCLDEGIRVVDTRHEQSAAHAADGMARISGRIGACAVTAGPGVTDAVTAVANAYRAQVPMIVFGGAGPTIFTHMGSLQDMDHVELMRPICKWAASVKETRRLAEYVSIAARKATSGVPGPVFLEVPLDVLMEYVDTDKVPIPQNYRTEARTAPDPLYLDKAVALLEKAERPMAIVGSQLRWSREPLETLQRFLDTTGIPTFVNGMARGLVDPQGPHFLNRSRKYALKNADCILILGTPFDFRLGYGQSRQIVGGSQSGQAGGFMLQITRPVINANASLIQVDLDGDEVGRNRVDGVNVGMVGDSGLMLEALTSALSGMSDKLTAWRGAVRQDEQKAWDKMRAQITSEDNPPNPLRVCEAVNRFLRPGDIVVGDGGDFVGTAAYVLKVFGLGTWMDPGPLGTLGVGPGYAMAAKLARPDARVVIMYGDGSFGLNGFEFEAMARQNIPVVGIIGNDAGWTQILRGQRDLYGKDRVVATKLDYTRYDLVAQGLGCHGEWVDTCEGLEPALERAFASGKAAVVNVKIGSSDFREGSISV